MMSIEEMIISSTCFGVAYDPTVIECKQCDVCLRCEQKCRLAEARGALTRPAPTVIAEPEEILEEQLPSQVSEPEPAPAKQPANKKTDSPKKPQKKMVKDTVKSKTYSPDMPEFREFTTAQLEQMVVERGGNLADFDKYTVANIRRMRLTMFLKSTYEV